jgi:O-antigen/teichoic acid export membrane protein
MNAMNFRGTIAQSSVTGLGAKFASVLLNLFGLPIAFVQLGTERFGTFLMLSGFMSVAALANFGLSRIVALHVAKRIYLSHEFAAQIFRTTIVFAAIIATVTFTILLIASLSLPWRMLIPGMQLDFYSDFTTAAIILALFMSIWIFITPFEGLATGLHQLAILNSFRISGYIFNIVGMLVVLPRYSSITMCVLLFSSGFILGDIFNAAYLALTRPILIFGRVRLRRTLLRSIIGDAFSGVLNSAGFAAVFQFSTGLLGVLAGPSQTVLYGLVMRVLLVGLSILQGYYGAVWPALARSLSKGGDLNQSINLTKQSFLVAFVAGSSGMIAFVSFVDTGFSLWLKSPIQFDIIARVSAGVLCFVVTIELALKSVLYAYGTLRFPALITMYQALIYISLSFIVMPRYQAGGGLTLLCLIYFCFTIPMLAQRYFKLARLLSTK